MDCRLGVFCTRMQLHVRKSVLSPLITGLGASVCLILIEGWRDELGMASVRTELRRTELGIA